MHTAPKPAGRSLRDVVVDDESLKHVPWKEWRRRIYPSIMGLYGYLMVEKGFFQGDPHPGNWYWEAQWTVEMEALGVAALGINCGGWLFMSMIAAHG